MRSLAAALALITLTLFAATPADAYLDVHPNRINFWQVYVGDISFTEQVYVTNRYKDPIVLRIYDNCYSDFMIDKNDCLYPISPGGRCTIRTQFWPSSPGWKWCSLDLEDNFNGWARVELEGVGVARPTPVPIPNPNP